MQIARIEVPDNACSNGSQSAEVTSLVNKEDACVEAGEKHWDVCVLNDKIYATVHECTRASGRVHEYSLSGQLLRIFKSELYNEPNMMDFCY